MGRRLYFRHGPCTTVTLFSGFLLRIPRLNEVPLPPPVYFYRNHKLFICVWTLGSCVVSGLAVSVWHDYWRNMIFRDAYLDSYLERFVH